MKKNLKIIKRIKDKKLFEVLVKTGGFGQYCNVWDKVSMFWGVAEKCSFREMKIRLKRKT